MTGLRVLSLFDGISCGHVALDRAGIEVETYYASEVDKYAIQISQKNYPDTIQLGDVTKIDFTQFIDKIDLLIGGSPCQDLSICGKREGLQGERSGLFYKYVEALETIKPKYFLLENNVGMPAEAYEEMSRLMGCYPVEINSALVSAQNRKRYYWTNIGDKQYNLFGFPTCDIPQPKDKHILLKDVLESGVSYQKKSDCLTTRYKGACFPHDYERHQRTMVAEPICINIPEIVTVRKHNVDIKNLQKLLREYKKLTNKEIAEILQVPITKVEHWFRSDDCFSIPDANIWFKLKNLLGIKSTVFDKAITEFEIKDNVYEKASRKYFIEGKMSTLTASVNDEIIAPLYLGHIGKTNAQANKVYSVKGKSVTLLANGGGGGGAKTDLYKIDLPDGEYIIRKLTPIECERLQTLPDNYTEGVSNTQRYKAIGNGWTVDVIAHIFSFIKTLDN